MLNISGKIGSVVVPPFLERPTGNVFLDVMPCVSMAACLPTLKMYYDKGRYHDLAVYTLGFLLAVLFHICHMHAEGLQSARYLGLSGGMWRTFDIVLAQICLARTLGHAVDCRHPIVASIPNLILPTLLGAYLLLHDDITMSKVSGTTLAVLLLTVACKLFIEGPHKLPRYSLHRGLRTAVSFALSFVSFVMPQRMPHQYWLWHSLWHLLLGVGYYELYAQLMELGSAAAAAATASPDECGKDTDGKKAA